MTNEHIGRRRHSCERLGAHTTDSEAVTILRRHERDNADVVPRLLAEALLHEVAELHAPFYSHSSACLLERLARPAEERDDAHEESAAAQLPQRILVQLYALDTQSLHILEVRMCAQHVIARHTWSSCEDQVIIHVPFIVCTI